MSSHEWNIEGESDDDTTMKHIHRRHDDGVRKEYCGDLSFRSFWSEYVERSKPMLLQECSVWPAIESNASDINILNYFRSKAPEDALVSVCLAKERIFSGDVAKNCRREWNFCEFLDHVKAQCVRKGRGVREKEVVEDEGGTEEHVARDTKPSVTEKSLSRLKRKRGNAYTKCSERREKTRDKRKRDAVMMTSTGAGKACKQKRVIPHMGFLETIGYRHLYLCQCPIGEKPENANRTKSSTTPPPSLRLGAFASDIRVPRCLRNTDTPVRLAMYFWLCGENVRSSVHYDCSHNLLCVVRGEKRVRLWPPSATGTAIAPNGVYDVSSANHGRILSARARRDNVFVDVTIREGDALFIPEGWWHSVVSSPNGGMTVGLNFWFDGFAHACRHNAPHALAYYARYFVRHELQKRLQTNFMLLTEQIHKKACDNTDDDEASWEAGYRRITTGHHSEALRSLRSQSTRGVIRTLSALSKDYPQRWSYLVQKMGARDAWYITKTFDDVERTLRLEAGEAAVRDFFESVLSDEDGKHLHRLATKFAEAESARAVMEMLGFRKSNGGGGDEAPPQGTPRGVLAP